MFGADVVKEIVGAVVEARFDNPSFVSESMVNCIPLRKCGKSSVDMMP